MLILHQCFSSVWPRAGEDDHNLCGVNHRPPGQTPGSNDRVGEHQRAEPHEEDHARHVQQALPWGPSGWY